MSTSGGFSGGPSTPLKEKTYTVSVVIRSGSSSWFDHKSVKAYCMNIKNKCFQFYDKEHKLICVYPIGLAFIEKIEEARSSY